MGSPGELCTPKEASSPNGADRPAEAGDDEAGTAAGGQDAVGSRAAPTAQPSG
ncbi:hypothetical protein ACWKSP_23545 [Micromonosporaceae bacterium Da 78-11]